MKKYLVALLFGCCTVSVKAQMPFDGIDVQHYRFAIQLSDDNDTVKGQAKLRIKFLKDLSFFQLNLVKANDRGKGMFVLTVTEDGKAIIFSQEQDVIKINTSAGKNSTHTYTVNYQGIPADGLIISTNKFGRRTFFGDNWPNRAHHWLPCADYPGDKAQVDFIITAPAHYDVVANGVKVEETVLPNHLKQTHWKETAQLPTKVMVIGVADFAIDHLADIGDIPIYSYLFPENKDAGFRNYAVAKEILPFYIGKIGPYPYKKLANIQSKTQFGGMENASAIFYFENSATAKAVESLMAHEIAHQWFGDATSEKDFSHLWLSEGFATYMTAAYLEHKYGVDTLKRLLIGDRLDAMNLENQYLAPVVDTNSNYMQLLNANSYQKGGWVLHMLRRKLGDSVFWLGIRNYYSKYNGGNASTDDLRQVFEQTSGQDLQRFFKQWLLMAGHPQLGINWQYDAQKGVINLQVLQKQPALFEFPLEVGVGGKVHTLNIKDRITRVQIAVSGAPITVAVDPNVNLFASIELMN